jgi:hypothetical protein
MVTQWNWKIKAKILLFEVFIIDFIKGTAKIMGLLRIQLIIGTKKTQITLKFVVKVRPRYNVILG